MISLTELRQDLYRKIDTLIETGGSIEVARRGHIIKISVADRPSKLAKLPKRADFKIKHPMDIIHHNWLKDWDHDLP
ncbi:MAG: hypothetical protein A3F17_01905 [Gammaproteobacteria bacterium RIFCSPHIGHO2_12_FULL_41_15]|nr:MAG: hypothetical protein A3F17_01905 [Gammaproteobacteria bacterium RIFCSPHIGHO2_12_FULL_41_15]